MIFLSNSSIVSNIFLSISGKDINKASQYVSIFFYTTHIILIIMCYIAFKDELKVNLKDFYNHLGQNIIKILIGLLVIILSNIVIGFFINQQGNNQESLALMRKGSSGFMIMLFYLSTVIIGPINEEFIFRRILIGEYQKYIKLIPSIVISSILFGLIHIHGLQEIFIIPRYIVIGLVFGIIYAKSNNIITSIILHILNNFLGVLLLSLI